MKKIIMIVLLLLTMIYGATYDASAAPAITGVATIDSPRLLNWGKAVDSGGPDLTEQTANRLADLHGSFKSCDMVLSTAGNYHMALRDLWYDVFLPEHASRLGLENWFFTTSPPVTKQQIQNSNVVFGNLALKCVPQVAVGPLKAINDMKAAGLTEGDALPIFRNKGNVLLVKKGNPKHIRSIWDLRQQNINVVTPNPFTETNTFDNYVGSIYNVALNDTANAPGDWTADRLFNSIFNKGERWLTGEKIHHREVPWSIAYGKGDVGVLFYHLALDAVRRFPDTFDIIPLGGTVNDPQPMLGNQIGAHYAIRIKGAWSDKQIVAREALMDAFASSEFSMILEKHGLKR